MDSASGISTLSFNKANTVDSRGNAEYNLDLYISGDLIFKFVNLINKKHSGWYNDSVLNVLTNNIAMNQHPWKNKFAINASYNLSSAIINYGNTISPNMHIDLYNALTNGANSVLNFDDANHGNYNIYRSELKACIVNASGNNENNGIIFHFLISTDNANWYINNFVPNNYDQAYKSIVLSQN